jgi:hypothetical protein
MLCGHICRAARPRLPLVAASGSATAAAIHALTCDDSVVVARADAAPAPSPAACGHWSWDTGVSNAHLVRCPRVHGVVHAVEMDSVAVPPRKYADCQPLPFFQWWLGEDMQPSETATARIGYNDVGLCFYVSMHDSHIFSHSTADQQKMWTLGDVCEAFVKPGPTERSDYWEVHVTPNGHLMDIHIPNREDFQKGRVTWDDVIAPSSGATYTVNCAEGKHWAVELTIPWSAFSLSAPPSSSAGWSVAVCRYNINNENNMRDGRELSATARFRKLSYHRHEEFSLLYFVK